ncbi:MAG TPA: hypothetical protein VFN61_16535 [Acidimicrobiales bacterium]|nr:hypothetical protein [Acidimicrobiales bacterium]
MPSSQASRERLYQRFLSTTDGGAAWSEEPFPSTGYVTGYRCFSASSCLAAGIDFGRGGFIAITSDSGRRWVEATSSKLSSTAPVALSCTTSGFCAALASNGRPSWDARGQRCAPPMGCPTEITEHGRVFVSYDGGQVWSAGRLMDLSYRTILLKTSSNVSFGMDGSYLPTDEISCPAPGKCWIGGRFGARETVDNAKTWVPGLLPKSAELLQISCPALQQCVALGGVVQTKLSVVPAVPVYSTGGDAS